MSPADTLQPWQPTREDPWNRRRAGHLLRRAGFGPTPAEVTASVGLGPEATVDALLAGSFPKPAPAKVGDRPDDKPAPPSSTHDPAEAVLRAAGGIDSHRAAWVVRMLGGSDPLRERLALFWHGHFATANSKVDDPALMAAMIDRLRDGATGPFGDLLSAMTADPAMIVWLDNNTNRKGHANENYAREIMELFALGVGNYSESDIREAGRAFTGWHTDRRRFTFNRDQWDDGGKTVFGVKGRHDGHDVVKLCLGHEACGRFIAGKLFAHLVHDRPDPAVIGALADGFRRDGLHVGRLVRRMLLSREFHSPAAYRALVKCPVELVVGSVRQLGARTGALPAAAAAADMGQSLYDPPSVKGWEGGRSWLNTATVLTRVHWLQTVAQGGEGGTGLPAGRLLTEWAGAEPGGRLTAKSAVAKLGEALLDGDLPAGAAAKIAAHVGGPDAAVDEAGLRTLAQAVLSLPEYQLA